MADTDFLNLPATNTIAATDAILLVRNGAAYRFSGTLPLLDAAGGLGIGGNDTGTKLSVRAAAPARGLVSTIQSGGGGALQSFYQEGVGYAAVGMPPAGNALSGYVGRTTNGDGLEVWRAEVSGTFRPGSDNAQPLGSASFRWSQIYAGSSTISTSDGRTKQDVTPIDDALLDAWAGVEWVRYRFIAAVDAKGDSARCHFGLVAQQVRDALDAAGIDGLALGVLCYDEWAATKAIPAVKEKRNRTGEIIRAARDAVPAEPAGNRWGIRYDEAQAIEAAFQRRRADRLEARLAAVETAS